MDYLHAQVLRERARAEPNLRVQSELWEQAGRAFDEIAAWRDIDAVTRKRAARTAVRCWKQLSGGWRRVRQAPESEPVPPPLPLRSRKLVAAIEVYRSLATADTDDDYVEMTLLEASTYERSRHLEEALRLYRHVVDHHRDRDAEDAELAAGLVRHDEHELGLR